MANVADTDSKSMEIAPDREMMVEVRGLRKYFPVREGLLRRQVGEVRAVDGVDFSIPTGTTFGLVGESGSGKTTLARAILRLIEPTDGTVRIDGTDVTALSRSAMRDFRPNMQIVFQDPTSSLNPRKSVQEIVATPLKLHDVGSKRERLERVEELLDIVDLPREFMYKHPTALSGGQKQRVGIARAIALNPKFVVLDEPTSALDVSVQARIMELFEDLQHELDLTYLFISHDLSVVKNVSDWIGVMYLGRLVEVGPVDRVFDDPKHPYTRALLSAIHTVTEEDRAMVPEFVRLEGDIPDPREKPTGCAFRSRCPHEFGPCADREPRFYEFEGNHYARCILHDDRHNPEGPPW